MPITNPDVAEEALSLVPVGSLTCDDKREDRNERDTMNGSERKPLDNSRSGTPVPPSSGGEAASLQAQLAAKGLRKSEAGHRHTPDELKRMSEVAEVTIHRRKRVVMRLA
jgi:hypothetical protein